MSKSKEATCKYNANRHCTQVYAFCTWKPKEALPPHLIISAVTHPQCKSCKAYIEAEEFQK